MFFNSKSGLFLRFSLPLLTVFLSFSAFSELLAAQSALSDRRFSPVESGLPAFSAARTAWGDYDRDGLPDLIISGYVGPVPTTLLLRNEGGGRFSATPVFLPATVGGNLAFEDLTGDSLPDILMTGTDVYNMDYRTRLFRNKGDGTFEEADSNLPSVNGGGITLLDANGDGLADAFVGGFDLSARTRTAHIYLNEGGRFSRGQQLLEDGLDSAFSAVGDLTGDGKPDLFVAGLSGTAGVGKIFRSTPEGFVDNRSELPGWTSGRAAIAEIDGDGRPDLFVRGARSLSAPSTLAVFTNSVDLVLTEKPLTIPGISGDEGISVIDLNADGAADLAAAGTAPGGSAVTLILLNKGDLQFSSILALEGLGAASDVDLNGDGLADLLVTALRPMEQTPVVLIQALAPALQAAPHAPARRDLPDLLIKGAKIRRASGRRALVSLTVRNAGDAAAAASKIALSIPGLKIRAIKRVPQLEPGSSFRARFNLRTSGRGRFRASAFADPLRSTLESDEGNNERQVGYVLLN